MTDREAIRRLAEIVNDVIRAIRPESCFPNMKQKENLQEVRDLIHDLSEPAGPTAELNTARTDWPIVCRHGTSVSCSCEFGRGYDQARRDMTADGLKAVLHPTVTREQAEWVSDVIQTKWYDMRAKQDDEREAPPVRYEMPAFFRAVADALDRDAGQDNPKPTMSRSRRSRM